VKDSWQGGNSATESLTLDPGTIHSVTYKQTTVPGQSPTARSPGAKMKPMETLTLDGTASAAAFPVNMIPATNPPASEDGGPVDPLSPPLESPIPATEAPIPEQVPGGN